jgi:hydroxypyruvate reductase
LVVVLSDVMGDPLETIGSGPFYRDKALVPHVIIGNNDSALKAAESFAAAHSIPSQILTRMEGEAKHQFARYRALARPGTLAIAGGEPTVKIVGNGKGGRAQEAALAAAIEIQNQPGIAVLSAGTDGSDGPTDAAGAIVTGDTIGRGGGLEAARKALANNDSYPFLARAGALLNPGPTGTNVNDLVLILRF